MTAQERTILTTTRDCPARLVPVGDKLTIPAHTFVTLTQSLGGNYTLTYNGNMVRVDGTDAVDGNAVSASGASGSGRCVGRQGGRP